MVNYADRMRYLVSKAGSLRKAEIKYGISRTTMTRVLRSEGKPTGRIKTKISTTYRKEATVGVRNRERSGLSSGVALTDRQTAVVLQQSYRQQGIETRVVVHASYERTILGIGAPTQHTAYGKGKTVEEAEANLEFYFVQMEEEYDTWTITKETRLQYRVYPYKAGGGQYELATV